MTRAPVALIVGPGCVSSCDSFALAWATFHLGPILGKQPSHAYTVLRLPILIPGPEGEDLGTLRVALVSRDVPDASSRR